MPVSSKKTLVLGFCSHDEETWPCGNAVWGCPSASMDNGAPPLPLPPHRLFPVERPHAVGLLQRWLAEELTYDNSGDQRQ